MGLNTMFYTYNRTTLQNCDQALITFHPHDNVYY